MLISMHLIDFLYIFSLVSGLILSIVILYRDYRSPVNIFFGLASLFALGRIFFVYLIIKSNYSSFLFTKLAYIATIPIPVLYLFFVEFYCKTRNHLALSDILYFLPGILFWFFFQNNLVLIGIELLPDNTFREYSSILMGLYFIYFISFFIYGYWILYRKYLNSIDNEKIQVAYVFLGTFLPSIFSAFVNILIPFLGFSLNLDLYNVSPLTTLLLNLFVFVAIFRYNFINFHYYLGRGVFFTLMAIISSAIYFLALFFMAKFFQNFSGSPSFLTNLIIFFILAVLLDPLRVKIEILINRTFSRMPLNYDEAISKILSFMDFSTDKTIFLQKVLDYFCQKLSINGACFLIYDHEKDRYEAEVANGEYENLKGITFTSNYPLIEYLNSETRPLNKINLEIKVSDQKISEADRNKILNVLLNMQKISAFLCIPGKTKNLLNVILVLSLKKSGEVYSDEEIDFFVTIINQVSVYLENIKLLEDEKKAIEISADAEEKEKHIQELEQINKDLLKSREALAKAERVSTASRLSIALQHEINNPLTSVLAITQALNIRMDRDDSIDLDFILEKLKTVKNEANRINQLLARLSDISEPIVREYMPGVEMIDLNTPENRSASL